MAIPQTPLLLREPESFVHALLGAQDMAALARTADRQLRALGLDLAQVVWNHIPGDPNQLHWATGRAPDRNFQSLLERARRQGGVAEDRDVATGEVQMAHVLAQNAGFWAALLCRVPARQADGGWRDLLSPLSLRCQSLLHMQRLQVDVERLANAERLQRALFAISDTAAADHDAAEMLHGLHQIVGRLMYAENFYIVRYDAAADSFRFIYFADTQDPDVPDPDEVLRASDIANSLTLALVRHGKPLRGPSTEIRQMLGVARDESLGPDSEDWLGVPMLDDGAVRGAVVVQSYDAAVRYTEADQALLSYVAQHILSALSRRDAQEELERRVDQRTQELRAEVRERERGEQLQRALFRIAEVSGSSASMDAFYAAVHEIVGGLLDARNFYIALLTNDFTELEFPYAVDERDARLTRRKLGRGLSEYVLRHGRPLLIERNGVDALEQAGEVVSTGTKSVCWLGVPLMIGGRVTGLIAVQSYTPDYLYTSRDEELLSFVSLHIANALERRRADDTLRQAYAELEQRVVERTRELA
ncbi:MAG: GAF domain-containing protein, partial [Arenimonas sp.]